MPKRSREELRKIIRETSRSQFILEEMQRFGFWPEGEEEPTLQEDYIRKETVLQKELNELLKQQRQQENTKALLKKMRKERMKEAKKRRAETKARRAEEKKQKAAAWAKRKASDITYLGEEVSFGLRNNTSDVEKLQSKHLPVFSDMQALATAMELKVGQLRWLTFNRQVATTSHYKRFEIPKKNGSTRLISAPMYLLKTAQHWVLDNILYKHPIETEAHGFVPERSIVTNAKLHVGQTLVINLDMKDFFPTITYKRIKGMFKGMGYSEQIATVLGLLCSEPETDEIELDGTTYYVQTGKRTLPQGAPTSPAITNIICRRLDRRLAGVAKSLGFIYSRYADDLTFSADETEGKTKISQLLWQVQQIVEAEGFQLHPDKQQIMRKGARREVTGIVVNEKANLDRKKLRQFRAVLHQIELNGPLGKTWGKGKNLFLSLQSFAAYVAMVNPEKGQPLVEQVWAIREKYDTTYRKRDRSIIKKQGNWWEKFLGRDKRSKT